MDELINGFMKNIKHLFTALLLLCSTAVTAHDFVVGGVYYNKADATNKTVEVTYKGDNYSSVNEYVGNVVIPESVTYDGVTYSITSIGSRAFSGCSSLTSVEIPGCVTNIGDNAFSSCSGLTCVVISDGVTSIGNYAFAYCSSLASIEIPSSVTSIGGFAFSGCLSLTNVEIPSSVTNIGERVLYACTGITSIIIGNNVQSIGYGAFESCSALETVINFSNLTIGITSSDNDLKVINAPNGSIDGDYVWTNLDGVNVLAAYLGDETDLSLPADYNGENYVIGEKAFSDCTGLVSIEIPGSVTSIGDYAFYNCTGLVSIEIPGSVTSIGLAAFENCVDVETLHIGNSLESIGDKAFAGCENIKEIKIGLERPIGGAADTFADAVYDNAILYVPYGTKSLYQEVEPWNRFFDIEEIGLAGIDDVKSEDGKVEGVCYDLSGRVVESPVNGIYIINGKKVWGK